MEDNDLNCRGCNSVLNKKILHLESMPLTDEFVSLISPHNEFLKDIEIYQCDCCGLVQNPVDFHQAEYYEKYNYSSGHSSFTKTFMDKYAEVAIETFEEINHFNPKSVIEIGSGDGEQLNSFLKIGGFEVLGVEPSESLVYSSASLGIKAIKGLFGTSILKEIGHRKFDICISSYTLDHVPSPNDYLKASYQILTDGGIIAFEIHDLSKIVDRAEWCLFEHEHTIYMDEISVRKMLSKNGFEVIKVNPISESITRANSLIVFARKKSRENNQEELISFDQEQIVRLENLKSKIDATVARIDNWIDQINCSDRIVGFGVGGRGVMTVAALKNSKRFVTIFDSNYQTGKLMTPKTRIAISGIDVLEKYNDAWCIVFSFGYYNEIKNMLISQGYSAEKIIPLNSFYRNVR